MLLRLRMSPYAYAYRTCKHLCACACACAYAYACVVRVNQALATTVAAAKRFFFHIFSNVVAIILTRSDCEM